MKPKAELPAPCRGSTWSHGAVVGMQFCDSNLPSLRKCILLIVHGPFGIIYKTFPLIVTLPVGPAVSDVRGTN
jgi:hypothetical protein